MKIKGTAKIATIRYHKDEWGIVTMTPVKIEEGNPILSENGTFVVKGAMVDPKVGAEYNIIAEEVTDAKWGKQYDITMFSPNAYVDEQDEGSKRKYLETLFTEAQVDALYKALPNPFNVLKERDAEQLIRVKGIGIKTISKYFDKFESNYYLSKLYVELGEYELTAGTVKKLVEHFKSPDIIIKRVKENPYTLTEVGGIGFKKADEIALKTGIDEWDVRRISAFILFTLDNYGMQGNSYISMKKLFNELADMFTTELPETAVINALNTLSDKLWWNEDQSEIGLKKYYELELNIADELKRIADAPLGLTYDDIDARMDELEEQQGWRFTDQQRLAIKTANANNLTVINGYGGTGKSTIAGAMIKMFKNHSSAACCLSGKAAARLGEAMGTNGSTIHRLLGFNPQAGGFMFDKTFQLHEQIIVVDEISMIGGRLFYDLLQAIRSGTKVIMLGDTGQLEAIGECNVASDIISSGRLAVVTLDKIHRQAAKSAIITESIKVRNGKQIIPKDFAGIEVRGEKQDMVLDCYSDKNNTAYKMLERFKDELKAVDGDVQKVQMIVPMKARTDASVWNLNKLAQSYCNPLKNQAYIEQFYSGRGLGQLRVGDKVICVKNNYKDCYMEVDGDIKTTPIFNGFTGMVVEIEKETCMVIDFTNVGRVIVPSTIFNTIELAYAITVHKSQGSQTETVLVGLDYGSYTLLSRELVYTAITRAMKKCIVVAQNTALRYAVMNNKTSTKKTHLQKLLNKS